MSREAIDTGLPQDAEALRAVVDGVPRVYTRLVYRCGQCHSFCAGTMFVESVCAKTLETVRPMEAPPKSCPLPVKEGA